MAESDVTANTRSLDRARALARVLDTAVGIPGTPFRLGLDAIVGLIPGAGDMIGALLSGYIVLAAARSGATTPVLLRMIGNIAIDTAFGSIPVLGDLFDVAFKANARNVALLERVGTQPAAVTRGSRRLGVVVGLVLVLVLLGLATLAFVIAKALWGLLTA
jgi:hypothetical protein